MHRKQFFPSSWPMIPRAATDAPVPAPVAGHVPAAAAGFGRAANLILAFGAYRLLVSAGFGVQDLAEFVWSGKDPCWGWGYWNNTSGCAAAVGAVTALGTCLRHIPSTDHNDLEEARNF